MTGLRDAMQRDGGVRRTSVPWCGSGGPDAAGLDRRLFGSSERSHIDRPVQPERLPVDLVAWRWERYLSDLRASGYVHANVVDAACTWARRFLGGRWPAAVPAGDGVMLVWEFDQRHVELQFDPDGRVEWFCKWRDTGRYLHGEPGFAWTSDEPLAATLTEMGRP
jgi:hypothetical protein